LYFKEWLCDIYLFKKLQNAVKIDVKDNYNIDIENLWFGMIAGDNLCIL